jgi:hypothetical protein
MADDATEHAIAIVRALDAAGALRTEAALSGSTGSERDIAAISSGVVEALSAAGVLITQDTANTQDTAPPPAPPEPPPEPQVGEVYRVQIDQLWKIVQTEEPLLPQIQIQIDAALSWRDPDYLTTHRIWWRLDFPPNDEAYLPEFLGLWASDTHRGLNIQASLEITEKLGATVYRAELRRLWRYVDFRFR